MKITPSEKNNQNRYPKAILFFCIYFLFANVNLLAQNSKVDALSDEQVKDFVEKSKASGMSEFELERVFKLKGYTQSDIVKMRERIANLGNSELKTTISQSVGRKTQEDLPEQLVEPVNTSTVFGAALFNNKSLTFEPNLRLPTPKNYQLGPDDELNVDIFGQVLDNYKLRISPEGTVKILNLAPININGLTIDAATDRIISRLRQLYQGLNQPGSGAFAQVTLGNVRSIKVTLIGEVARPGTYTVSSLSTLFNALYNSGGPSSNGSFRKIRLIRNNKVVTTLDLYDFLLRADQKNNVRLQDQDVIRVADYETKVEIAGQVKRPLVYEVESGETIKDVLRFAGGFTDKAYTYSIKLQRVTPKELKLITLTQDEIATFIPQNGDKYTVGEITARFENRVSIVGAVFREGEFALEKGTSTVKELIKKAEGLTEEAFLNRAYITRQKENAETEIITFDLGKVMRSEIADIPLKREDILTISKALDFQEKRTVIVRGEVNKPDSISFVDGMTLSDAIFLANGFTDAAIFSQIEIARRVKNDTLGLQKNQNIRIFSSTVDGSLKLTEGDGNMPLKAYDIITVRRSPRYEAQKVATISGEVYYPGTYAIKDRLQRISDLINTAGGFKDFANKKNAKYIKNGVQVAIDINKILNDNAVTENLLLENGDILELPALSQVVTTTGELQTPFTLAYDKKLRTKDYFYLSGGTTNNADLKKVNVRYSNGKSAKTKNYVLFKKYPKMEEGAVLVVPKKPGSDEPKQKPSFSERMAVITAITTGATSIALLIVSIINAGKN
ncbi:MAG: SLBB domain-containing protein [Pseudarcicella sp.]|nr:SLBB domain-containing protein [Pseudarcicella sp.]